VATPGMAVPASPSPKWQSLQALALEIYTRTLPIASDTSRRSQCMTVDGFCSFEAKIGDLPKETITAYTFPLASIDLILGLPWLQKHNPHTDWKKLTFEFHRNGRRYMLWPAKPEMAIGLYDSDSGLRSGPGFTGIGCAVFQHHHTRFDFVPDRK